ncbi:hypothetical protein HA402_005039 [Bradysia odoriphaga]|nr:hypothetical protein HA402_005039 [Bradysia odoriphaga]
MHFLLSIQCFARKCRATLYAFIVRATETEPHQLDVGRPETIMQAVFVKDRPLIIIIHGFTGHKDFSPNPEIRPAYLKHADYNIISVDYHPLAPEPCYVQAVQNLPTVGNCTAQLIDYLIQKQYFTLDVIHVIGFSLGAQTAGMVAGFIKSGRLKRITGLDPAKPLFIFANNNRKLGQDDAEFVDVIHTDVLQRGVLAPCGHADFYVNGGISQHGCEREKSPGGCNHDRAPAYYAESISSKEGFWAYKCKDWMQWAFGFCTPKSSTELALMGAYASKDARGSYFLDASSQPPYAQGVFREFSEER